MAGVPAAAAGGPSSFDARLEAGGHPLLRRRSVGTLQVNLLARCNLACLHCHVESGPKRSEALDRRGIERIVHLLARNPGVAVLDLTGGAPEMHPDFRFLVREARALGRRVIDRCNLTILHAPEQAGTAEFLAGHQVEIVASLPCYTRDNVDRQRGTGVFDESVAALRLLNALGYARDPALRLDLIYNPLGATLPPSQGSLEADYRRELHDLFGIEFDRLLTITNMPIKRFAHALARDGRLDAYQALLVERFNAATLPDLMCRDMISVSWDGRLHDCDFNQMLDLDVPAGPRTIWDVDDLTSLVDRPIATAGHCFGCTAGAGSSCGGALV